MLLCPRQKYLWIEVPKTGSSALKAALKGRVFLHSMKHVASHNARRLMGAQLWDSYDTRAVIREPMDWLGSWYRFFLKADQVGNHRSYSLQGKSFAEFIAHTEEDPELAQRLRPQSTYVSDPTTGEVLVKNLIPYEYLSDDISRFADLYSLRDIELPRVNVGASVNLGDIPSDIMELIQTKWATDFDLHRQSMPPTIQKVKFWREEFRGRWIDRSEVYWLER